MQSSLTKNIVEKNGSIRRIDDMYEPKSIKMAHYYCRYEC